MTIRLSPREREVVSRLAQGSGRKAIAAELHISVRTVAQHLANARLRNHLARTGQLVFLMLTEKQQP